MDYSQLSDEELLNMYKQTSTQPTDYSKMSDDELVKLYQQQGNQIKQAVKQEAEKKKGLDLTPSGLVDKAGTGLASLILGGLSPDKTIPEAYQELSKQPSPISPSQKFAFDLLVYNTLGGATGLAKLPFLEGALIGGLEGLKEGNNTLASAVAGGAFSSGIQKGLPLVKQGASKVAGAYLNSGIPEKLANAFANITPEIIRKAIKEPDILAQGARAGILGEEKYYANKYRALGQEFLKNLQKTTSDLASRINKIKESFVGEEINQGSKDYKQLLSDIEDVFNKRSDVAVNAKEIYSDITKALKDLYDNKKPKTLNSLNLLKENLVSKIRSKYPKELTKEGSAKVLNTEEKITNEIERKIDQYIKSKTAGLAGLQEKSATLYGLQEILGLNSKTVTGKIRSFGEPKSLETTETKALKDLENLFLQNPKTLSKAQKLKVQEKLNRISPETSGLTQILTRKALPYLGMGTLGLVGTGMNPLGFMAGLATSGLLTSPKFHGMTISKLSKLAGNPKISPEVSRRFANLASQIYGGKEVPTRILEGRVEKSNLD